MSIAKKVLIAGAGFGGVYTAKALLPMVKRGIIEITIVDKNNYFLFTPLLHEVATGGLSSSCITESLRDIFRDEEVKIIEGVIGDISKEENHITLKNGHKIPYDVLVLSVGSESAYYGVTGAEEHAMPLKTLSDANRIRNAIYEIFEKKMFDHDDRNISFVIVGGGATGVELVTEIHDLVFSTLKKYYAKLINFENINIHLVSRSDEPVSELDRKIREDSKKALAKENIILHMGQTVKRVGHDYVELKDGVRLYSNLTLWTAGVNPTMIPERGNYGPISMTVDPYLRKAGSDNIFVMGDAVSGVVDGRHVPKLAQVAVAEAEIVAENILASIKKTKLKSFSFHSKGNLLSLGRWNASGVIFGVHINGVFAWWLWRTVYLSKFISWRKRLRVALEWTINIFYPRDIGKV